MVVFAHDGGVDLLDVVTASALRRGEWRARHRLLARMRRAGRPTVVRLIWILAAVLISAVALLAVALGVG